MPVVCTLWQHSATTVTAVEYGAGRCVWYGQHGRCRCEICVDLVGEIVREILLVRLASFHPLEALQWIGYLVQLLQRKYFQSMA